MKIFVRKAGVFPLEKVTQHKKFFIVSEIRRTVLKNKILHCFKRRHSRKLCCERTSQFYVCVYIQCRRRRLTDWLHLNFSFAAETDVLVPVVSQSTDVVVVVNFVVVLKFPVVQHATTIVRLVCQSDQLACFCFLFFRPCESFGCEAAREFQNLSFPFPSRAALQLLCQNFVRAYDPADYCYWLLLRFLLCFYFYFLQTF